MNRSEILKVLNYRCFCAYDHKNQEYYRCDNCEAYEYITTLTDLMSRIGCDHCNGEIKEMLK